MFAACVSDQLNSLVAPDDLTTPDPVPLAEFAKRFPDAAAIRATANGQLTSA